MRFVDILAVAAGVSGAVAAPTKTIKRAGKFDFVGVSESGAEFGNTALPGQLGKDYTWPDHSAISVSSLAGWKNLFNC